MVLINVMVHIGHLISLIMLIILLLPHFSVFVLACLGFVGTKNCKPISNIHLCLLKGTSINIR